VFSEIFSNAMAGMAVAIFVGSVANMVTVGNIVSSVGGET